MFYKVLSIILLSCSFIETLPPRKPTLEVDGQSRGILVFDDIEDSVPENLDDLEVRRGSSDDEYDDTILDPLAADKSRNPSPRPDVNGELIKNISTTSIPNSENHGDVGDHLSDHTQWETVTENTQGKNPGSDDIFNRIRDAVFEVLDENTQKMKEGVHSMLEVGKNIFNGGKNSQFGWNIFGNFWGTKTSERSTEFEEFSLR